MKVKTISFDLWGTLIQPNPEFKQLRIEYLQQHTNKTSEEIVTILNKIKTDVDRRVEKYGIQYNDADLYKMVLNMLDIETNEKTYQNYMTFCHTTFIKHPPILKPQVINLLELLKAHQYRMIISSNTLFIGGKVMRTVLMKLGIFDYFYDCIFSDEIGYSKPHIEFFKQVHQRSHTYAENILHTGDNTVTDMNGCRSYGMQLFYAPEGFSNPETVSHLLDQLKIK